MTRISSAWLPHPEVNALPPACPQVLVLDNCMGVVTGAVLERMAGLGGVCSTHLGRPFSSDALRGMNLSEAERAILCTMSIAQLRQAQQQRQAVSMAGWGCLTAENSCSAEHVAMCAAPEQRPCSSFQTRLHRAPVPLIAL